MWASQITHEPLLHNVYTVSQGIRLRDALMASVWTAWLVEVIAWSGAAGE